VFGIRGILEGYAGFLATERIEEDELTSLEEIIAREEACLENMNPEEFIRLDGELHDVLYKAAKDTRLYNLLNDLRDKKQEPETGCKARKKAYDEGQGHYQEEDQAGSGAEDMILKAQIAQIPIRGYRRLLSVRASEW
jgi:DNA-binding GntR family transcriptional regulator